MKKDVNNTLRLAVEQLFIRLHGKLFATIYPDNELVNFDMSRLKYNPENPSHVQIVSLCKEKLGYTVVATDQDVFFSIMTIYMNYRKENPNYVPSVFQPRNNKNQPDGA